MSLYSGRIRSYILAILCVMVMAFQKVHYTNKPEVRIKGRALDAVSVLVNGDTADFEPESGYFEYYAHLKEGRNQFTIVAQDALKNATEDTLIYVLDTIPPKLKIFSDIPARTNKPDVEIEGLAEGASEVYINNRAVKVENGYFSAKYNLIPGKNYIKVRAVDALGNDTFLTIETEYDNIPPEIEVFKPHTNALYFSKDIKVLGRVYSAVKLTVDGTEVSFDTGGMFAYDKKAVLGANEVKLVVWDDVGNSTVKVIPFVVSRSDMLTTSPFFLKGDTIYTTSEVYKFTGVVKKQNLVIIDSMVLKPDSTGHVEADLKLKEGLNRFKIEVYGDTD